MATKICSVCGTEFDDPKHPQKQYCSRSCFAILRTERVTLTCAECGKDFEAKPAQPRRFCSQTCSNRFNQPRTKIKVCICEWCKTEFETWESRPGRFCSNQCRSEFAARQPKGKNGERVTVCCEQCGRDYVILKSYFALRGSRFCSSDCKFKAMSVAKMGAGNPNYIGGTRFPNRGSNWSAQRKSALERDGRTCQRCGTKKRRVDVHHIKPYREFDGDYLSANALPNLITLCRRCHNQVERHGAPCPQPLF